MRGFGARSQRGVTTVEYLIIVAGISLVAVIGASRIGIGVSSSLCETGTALGGSGECTTAAAAPTATASSTSAPLEPGTPVGGGGSNGTTTTPTPTTSTSAVPTTSAAAGGGSGSAPSPTPTPTPTPTNSPGSMVYNTATIDQDGTYLSDLSVRFNIGWFPSNWNQVAYPTTMSVDVTWTPALAVDKVIAGSDGTWTYTLIEPGKMRLTRTGSFDTSGFQPEPEILLVKPTTQQNVQVSFSASAPNSPTLTRSASTTSIPY